MRCLCLFIVLSSVAVAHDVPDLPPSATDSLADYHTMHVDLLDPITGEQVRHLESGLPLSRVQILVREYHEISSLLVPYQKLLLLFRLIHKGPLFNKNGLRRTYKRAIKAFESQASFALLPRELQDRIRTFHRLVVALRPVLSTTEKVLMAAAIVAVGSAVAYKFFGGSRTPVTVDVLPDNDFAVDGKIDMEKLMLLLEPDKENRFKKKPTGYTRVSFNQEKMQVVLKDLNGTVCNLFKQNADAAQLLRNKEARGEYININTDPIVQGMIERLIAVGRICLYLEGYDRTTLKKAILYDDTAMRLLLDSINCPMSDEIFNKVCMALGITTSSGYQTIQKAFGVMKRPSARLLVKSFINGFADPALPDGPAGDIKNNKPGVWNDGAQPYDISGVR